MKKSIDEYKDRFDSPTGLKNVKLPKQKPSKKNDKKVKK